ncbi:MAG: aminopeptidase P family protein [Dehalococcoidia bacterium]
MTTDQRLVKLRGKLAENGLDAILISQPENRFYLSGFSGSAGYLMSSADQAVIATDFRYFEQSRQQCPGYQLVKIAGGERPLHWLEEALSIVKPKRLGFESGHVPHALYTQLRGALSEMDGARRPRLMSTQHLVESLRATKDEEEIEAIQAAAGIADAALEEVVPAIEAGMSEKQVAWELEKAVREHGADGVSFDTIVASGPNGALPHHRPGDRTIREGEPVVIDMGARLNGYCSDITRTVVMGRPDATLTRVYDTVLAAQLTAIATVQSGMTGHDADGLARKVIEQAGYGDNFGHSLGHGIGLAVHEHPRLGPNSSSSLDSSMVFTIEPGIYIPGWGGVRIEDMVVLQNGRARVLTETPKALD